MKKKIAFICVYMLVCQNGAIYTGITRKLEQRLKAHVTGRGARYTRSFPPRAVVYLEKLVGLGAAFAREAEIKRMSTVGKKKLIHSQSGNLPSNLDFQSLPYCPELVFASAVSGS